MKERKPLPDSLIQSLAGLPGYDAEAFKAIHASGKQVTTIRINPSKFREDSFSAYNIVKPVPWTKFGYYLQERPAFTLDPLLHAGAYYVQEASSMFLEQAIQQAVDLSKPIIVLDLCAAPGGKSTHIQSLLPKDAVLVSNELVKSRANILIENITKWGANNVIVTNNDPSDFAALKSLFDLVVVDAPCSGSGLFRKDPDAMDEWSVDQVSVCAIRQQKILEDIWPALKPGGIMIYSTCSYSKEEDEMIANWLLENKQAEIVELNIKPEWNIVASDVERRQRAGYRFYPDKLDGEGFYLTCFRKLNGSNSYYIKSLKNKVDKKLEAIAREWISNEDGLSFYQHKDQLFAMRDNTLQLLLGLHASLNIRKAGFKVGDWIRNEIVPDHALALSAQTSKAVQEVNVDRDTAIEYLRKNDFSFNSQMKGWIMIRYMDYSLGWIKNMGNRMNNYYPKEWRIRM